MANGNIFWGMSEEAIRQRVVAEAVKHLGVKEGSAEHKKIVDIYNNGLSKLPRGYKLRYTDPWCAGFISYVGIVLGIAHVILPEVGCGHMIELYKKAGRWEERDDYIPKPGDICMLDWDAQKGECVGAPDHVEWVEWCDGKNMGLVGGNSDNQVKRRTVCVEYVKVRGYCLPDYGSLVRGFTDVPADAWYRAAVEWADARGIIEGIGGHEFAPNMACTRAHVVTMLHRYYGSSAAGGGIPFRDVDGDAWYAEAVRWAAQQGITEGIAEDTFDPYGFCTRAQIAAMLWRAAGRPMAENGNSPFADVPGDAWYADAVEWAWCRGITVGISGTEFSPYSSCTRAQLVAMLYRLAHT